MPNDATLTTPPRSTSLGFPRPEPETSGAKVSQGFPLWQTDAQASPQQSMAESAERSSIPQGLPKEVNLTAPLREGSSPSEPLFSVGTDSSISSNAPPIAFQPGTQIPARLATGIAVIESVSTPVVAETLAGGAWCGEKDCPAVTWLGTARLTRPGRVDLRFEQAVVNGEARVVTASALGNDNIPGLAASVSDTSPTVGQDLLRAAAGGVSDYVGALAKRQTVTLKEGMVIQDFEVPLLDQFLFGRAAKLFDLPSAQTTIVRVAQVEVGTELMVLYGLGE